MDPGCSAWLAMGPAVRVSGKISKAMSAGDAALLLMGRDLVMPKNIVICCDGTANEFAENNTNVVKLYYTLDQDASRQLTYYHPGLGTMEPAGALTTFARRVTKVLGMAIGYGLSNDIRDVYVFLMNYYEKDDKVFLFGFSRGAYTVRAVCSLLHLYGLIRRGNEPLVPYAIRMMTGINRANRDAPQSRKSMAEYFELARSFRRTLARTDCKPWFVGVWDTVSSVGWVENPLKLPYVSSNPDIQIGRHAVAIDERRAFFRNHLWRRPDDQKIEWGPKDVKQVWFPGVHCDVGGGYPESESGLSKIALEWILQEAKAAGLMVDPAKEREVLGLARESKYIKPDFDAEAHESLKGAWHLAEFFPKQHYDWKTGKRGRRLNLYRRRTIPPGSLVHTSAYARKDGYRHRVPPDAIQTETLRVLPPDPPTSAP
jgi:uncharacterized protein (DUF2235 family)